MRPSHLRAPGSGETEVFQGSYNGFEPYQQFNFIFMIKITLNHVFSMISNGRIQLPDLGQSKSRIQLPFNRSWSQATCRKSGRGQKCV